MTVWPRTPPTQLSSLQMTTVVGLITNNNSLVEWCQENNLSLNIKQMTELIMGFRKQQREHAPNWPV